AKRRAAAGDAGPLWLIAVRQTAGYGRRGAPWMQEEGDVAATFLFREGAPSETLPQLSFVAALAVGDAIRRFAPKADLSLKWPNDALAGGGKIAGLLLELLTTPSTVALGVGVNVVSSPQGLDYPAARLIDFGASPPPHPRAFVEEMDATFAVWRAIWRNEGFAPVRAEWLARAEGLGRAMRVQSAGEIVEGVFKDLDLDGALILDCDGARRTIAAGAVLPAETFR
ncbi:MAG: biotin--[acetyl-CoA-carboxylase] ligase, partial [Parvularculaceae bacterium]|nr:biotin--[acetyl-CoA-carboxylase] ligase [Parvularculaceae bacterium]